MNPHQNLRASLESDGRTVYLYLTPDCECPFPPRALWICNLSQAPEKDDTEARKSGVAPLAKRSACRHPEGCDELEPDNLRLEWSQEGCGVAIFSKETLLGYISPFQTGTPGFGYSAEAVESHMGTHPFPKDSSFLQEKIAADRSYWKIRSEKGFWDSYRDRLLVHYESVFGKHSRYFALVDRPYPPLAIVEFTTEKGIVYTTLGMSNQNMPYSFSETGEKLSPPRVELLFQAEKAEDWVPSAMGIIASYPWATFKTVAPGHIFETGTADADFLLKETGPLVENIPKFTQDSMKVQFLSAERITKNELEMAKKRGANALQSDNKGES